MYHNVYICSRKQKHKTMEYSKIKSEANQLYLASKTESDRRFYLLVLLALETGARVSDLLKLSLTSHFIEEDGTPYVMYRNTKSKKRQVQKLSNETYQKAKDIVGDSTSIMGNCLFYNDKKGAMMSRITANRKCTKVFGFNFHNLRKIAGKNIASQKGVIYASKFLGHSKVSTTDIYLGISTDQFKKDMLDVVI